jgi:predicted phage terminase large subunit-like protein
LRTSLESAFQSDEQWSDLHSQALGALVRTDSVEGLIAYNDYVLGFPAAPHHREMLEAIYEAIATRQNIVVLEPRGAAKTTHGNTGLCAWLISNFPDIAIGLMSNTQTLADGFSRAVRNTVELNPRHIELFGSLKAGDLKWTDGEWIRRDSALVTTNNATMYARGVGGAIISKRFDIIICDDILDEENSATPESREKVKDWLMKTVLPCLKPDGVVVVLGTRWAVEDVYELLITPAEKLVGKEHGKGWKHLVRSALVGDLSERTSLTSYWPGYWSVDRLFKMWSDLGTPMFMCAYQNDVSGLLAGNIFPSKFQYFDTLPEGHAYSLKMGVDLASSEKERADYTARVTTAEDVCTDCTHKGNFYVMSASRDKRETHHAEFIHEGWLAFPEIGLVICESQQFQSTLIQEVMADYPRIPIEGRRADTDKTTRARAAAAKYEAGKVFHRSTLEGSDFEQELRAFPKGHDDQVDALGYSMDLGGSEFFYTSVRRR